MIISDSIFHMFWISGNIYAHNTCFKQRNLSGLIIFCWIIGTWNQKHNLTISLTDKPYPEKELTTYSICWWEVQMPSPSAPPPPTMYIVFINRNSLHWLSLLQFILLKWLQLIFINQITLWLFNNCIHDSELSLLSYYPSWNVLTNHLFSAQFLTFFGLQFTDWSNNQQFEPNQRQVHSSSW